MSKPLHLIAVTRGDDSPVRTGAGSAESHTAHQPARAKPADRRGQPMKKVVRMIREHLWGILNAIVLKVHNGGAESINSKIQLVKYRARGFRNRQRFINARKLPKT